MTDNAKNYTRSRDFRAALVDLGARHKRTRAYRPQTNGKSERFNRTLLDEWAYARPYGSNNERLRGLRDFVDRYNSQRPHTSLQGLTPMAALVNNVSGNHSQDADRPVVHVQVGEPDVGQFAESEPVFEKESDESAIPAGFETRAFGGSVLGASR